MAAQQRGSRRPRICFSPCTCTERARTPRYLAALQPDPVQRRLSQGLPEAPALRRWQRPLDPATLTVRRRWLTAAAALKPPAALQAPATQSIEHVLNVACCSAHGRGAVLLQVYGT